MINLAKSLLLFSKMINVFLFYKSLLFRVPKNFFINFTYVKFKKKSSIQNSIN
jgi:hypothetical protein